MPKLDFKTDGFQDYGDIVGRFDKLDPTVDKDVKEFHAIKSVVIEALQTQILGPPHTGQWSVAVKATPASLTIAIERETKNKPLDKTAEAKQGDKVKGKPRRKASSKKQRKSTNTN